MHGTIFKYYIIQNPFDAETETITITHEKNERLMWTQMFFKLGLLVFHKPHTLQWRLSCRVSKQPNHEQLRVLLEHNLEVINENWWQKVCFWLICLSVVTFWNSEYQESGAVACPEFACSKRPAFSKKKNYNPTHVEFGKNSTTSFSGTCKQSGRFWIALKIANFVSFLFNIWHGLLQLTQLWHYEISGFHRKSSCLFTWVIEHVLNCVFVLIINKPVLRPYQVLAIFVPKTDFFCMLLTKKQKVSNLLLSLYRNDTFQTSCAWPQLKMSKRAALIS